MGLLSWITGAGKAGSVIEKVADGIFSGADKLKLTDEERLDYNADAGKFWLQAMTQLNDENSARAITRRYIAVAVIYSWLFMNLITFTCAVFELGKTHTVDHALQLFVTVNEVMGLTVLAVIGFYFGFHMTQRIIEEVKKPTPKNPVQGQK